MHSISAHTLNRALWRAVWLDDLETVKWALEKGGRLTCLDHPPFYYQEPAPRDSRYDKYTPDWSTETKWTAAHVAARNGNKRMIELLAKHGWSMKVMNNKHKTPLEIARLHGHKHIHITHKTRGASARLFKFKKNQFKVNDPKKNVSLSEKEKFKETDVLQRDSQKYMQFIQYNESIMKKNRRRKSKYLRENLKRIKNNSSSVSATSRGNMVGMMIARDTRDEITSNKPGTHRTSRKSSSASIYKIRNYT